MNAELVPLFAHWDLKDWYKNRHEHECLSRVCKLTKNLECVQPPCSSFLTNSWRDLHSQRTHTSKTSPFKPRSQRPPWNPRRPGPRPDCPGNSAHLWVERICPLCEIEKFPETDISSRWSYPILLKLWGLWLNALDFWCQVGQTNSEVKGNCAGASGERKTMNMRTKSGNHRWGKMGEK